MVITPAPQPSGYVSFHPRGDRKQANVRNLGRQAGRTIRDLINDVNDISEKMKRHPDDTGDLQRSYNAQIQEFSIMVNEGKLRDSDIPQIELLKDKNVLSAIFQSPYVRKLSQKTKTSLMRHMKQLSFQSNIKFYSNELTAGDIAHEFKEAHKKGKIILSETELHNVNACLGKRYKSDAPDYLSDIDSETIGKEPPCFDISEPAKKAFEGFQNLFRNCQFAKNDTEKAVEMIDDIKIIRDKMACIKKETHPEEHQQAHNEYNDALKTLEKVMKSDSFRLEDAIHTMHSIKDYKVEGLIFKTGQITKVIENPELKEELFDFMDFLKMEENRGIDYERKYGLEFVLRASHLAEMFLKADDFGIIKLDDDEIEKMKKLINEEEETKRGAKLDTDHTMGYSDFHSSFSSSAMPPFTLPDMPSGQYAEEEEGCRYSLRDPNFQRKFMSSLER